jgi:integrase
VPKSETWCPFFLITPADMSCLTATQSISFAKAPNAERRTPPTTLVPADIKALIDGLALRERTLVLLAASTGLRQSEIFGLKWGDIDFERGTMSVIRSIVYGVVGPCKTESSQKPVPMHPTLADALTQWRKRCTYTTPEDWVFASKRYRGRRPYWGQAILRKYVRPAGQRAGIQKRFGSTLILNSAAERGDWVQGDAGAAAAFFVSLYPGRLHAGSNAREACSAGGGDIAGFSSDKNGTALVAG